MVQRVRRIEYADGYVKYVSPEGERDLQKLCSYAECTYSMFGQLKESTYVGMVEMKVVEDIPIQRLDERIRSAVRRATEYMNEMERKKKGLKVVRKRAAVSCKDVKSIGDLFI
jgi:phosphoribosylformylglycinamidine (FGAM) synthase-like enzyme